MIKLANQAEEPKVGKAWRSAMILRSTIRVPALAIFAVPHDLRALAPTDPAARAAAEASDLARTGAQADAFEKGIPSARVVRLPHANHCVFLSNKADVLREMNLSWQV